MAPCGHTWSSCTQWPLETTLPPSSLPSRLASVRKISRSRWFLALRFACLATALLAPFPGRAAPKKGERTPVLRWEEGKPGCTFNLGTDGKYRYALWADDVAVTLAVDAQEIEKTRRRVEQIFGVLLTVNYRGSATLEVRSDQISLQYVKHHAVTATSIDPDDFSQRIQSDADDLIHASERQIAKHPEKKDAEEAKLQAYQKDVSEMQEFLGTKSLRPAKLDPANPEVTGWIFFSTKSRWLGDWKKQEEFVLRFPFEKRVFEFPFMLPPKEGELILRQRGQAMP